MRQPFPSEKANDPTRETVLDLIAQHPGISDHELAERVFGPGSASTMVNTLMRALAAEGVTRRRLRPDTLLGSWLAGDEPKSGG